MTTRAVFILILRGHSVAESRDGPSFLWGDSPGLSAGSPGPVHDDGDPGQDDRAAQEIEPVGRDAVHGPAPDDRQHDERAAVRRVHAPEVLRLVRRHEPVGDEDGGAEHAEDRRRAVAPPLPHEIAAADLAESGHDEERERADHVVVPPAPNFGGVLAKNARTPSRQSGPLNASSLSASVRASASSSGTSRARSIARLQRRSASAGPPASVAASSRAAARARPAGATRVTSPPPRARGAAGRPPGGIQSLARPPPPR